MSEERNRTDSDQEKTQSGKVTRRSALTRIARSTLGIGLFAALPAWAMKVSGLDEEVEKSQLQAYYYSYYVSYSYYSYYSSYAYDYYSSYSYYGSPGGTCFIDTLKKKKKK